MFARKSRCLHIVFIMVLVTIAAAAGDEVYFTSYPCLSPDAGTIVFRYEGDLWKVDAGGGTAFRLTGMEGFESVPRFSPDGKWLAFTASEDGNANVYVMPSDGGEIRQLTFHESFDMVESWSWDSQAIYFTSGRYNNFSSYRISLQGGTPVRLFGNYFNTIHGVVAHPRTGTLFFTDTWESMFHHHRKRYKGDYNPDIKSYNPETKEFKVLTDYRGKDMWPFIDRQGNLYFASDEWNGEYNLYTFRSGRKVRLTAFDTSIKFPQVSANGQKVVFERDYQLYTYDVASQKVTKVPVRVFRNERLNIRRDFNVKGKITYFDASPDGKKLAFVSRGELFVSDVKGKFIHKLRTAPEGRVVEVKWLKDNRTLLFNQTVDGWLNLFKISADGPGQAEQLTFDIANNRKMALDGKRSRALYLCGGHELRLLSLDTFKSKTIVKDEFWGLLNRQPLFSPDGRCVVYTARRNFEQDIFVYEIDSGKSVNITDSGVSETDPFWSPDGKHLFFAADLYHPRFPRSLGETKIFRVPLEKYRKPFKSTEFRQLFAAKGDAGDQAEPAVSVSIDYRDIMTRREQISPRAGSQESPYVIRQKDDPHTCTVLYLSDHDGQKPGIWKTVIKDFDAPKTEKIKGAAANTLLICRGEKKYYTLIQGEICQLDLKANKVTPIGMDFTFRKDLNADFKQMFAEIWANVAENFYDETFHGVDWQKIKEKYAGFLPHIVSRANLKRLIRDMLGELNASHLGFGSRGDEEKTFHDLKTMETGILFDNDAPYRVKAVVKNSAADKKGIDIRPGDILTAVNNTEVEPGRNREYYFLAPSVDEEITLTFKRGTNTTYQASLHPQTSGSFKQNLYDEWIEQNQDRVDRLGKGRIAYVYMKDMGGRALRDFLREMVSEAYRREALILDLRYNTGGNVHDAVLNFLTQQPYTMWKYRGGEYAPQPHFSPAAKPLVLLVNEQTLSDGEMTAAGFKALKLGTIIGTETYRWLIFTTGKTLVDGSYYRLPSWGCFTLSGQDLELHGVKPDITIKNTFPDRLQGRDPQLTKAITLILDQLKN